MIREVINCCHITHLIIFTSLHIQELYKARYVKYKTQGLPHFYQGGILEEEMAAHTSILA